MPASFAPLLVGKYRGQCPPAGFGEIMVWRHGEHNGAGKTGWQKGRQDVRPDVELQLGLKPGGSGVGLVTPFCLGAPARMLSTGINDE